METLTPTERLRIRKQTADQSVKLAVAGRWNEAVTLNRELLDRIGRDLETYNRLGKALTELGRISEAREAYQEALRIQPGNPIATRNLNKLATMADQTDAAPQAGVRTSRFIEESGTQATVTLQAVDAKKLGPLDAGDSADLEVRGNAVNVNAGGAYLGMLDPKIGLRLSRLIEGGNTYDATLVTASEPVRVMIEETYRHPSQKGKVSFPQAKDASGVRAYVRKGLLRDEVKLDFGVDDEEEDTPDTDEDDPEGYQTIDREDDENEVLASVADDDDEEEPSDFSDDDDVELEDEGDD